MKTTLRVRKCCQCPERFMQQRLMQKACSPACAQRDAEVRRLKQEAARKREERQADRAKKLAMTPLRKLLEQAQDAFNAYIRFRDRHQRCICCDQPFEPEKLGGAVDAGHFRTRAAAPHLRFNEDNVFAQRKNCNRPGGTTYSRFRIGVLTRIGQERTEAVENNNTDHKWTREEVIHIRDHYRAKLKQAKKEAA